MTYSYGRALQQSALKLWSKDIKNINETQKVFNHRAKMNMQNIDPNAKFVDLAALSMSGDLVPSVPT